MQFFVFYVKEHSPSDWQCTPSEQETLTEAQDSYLQVSAHSGRKNSAGPIRIRRLSGEASDPEQ
jgi:hypothetical protein